MASALSGSDGRKAGIYQAGVLGQSKEDALGAVDAGTTGALSDLGKARSVYNAGQTKQLSTLGGAYDNAQGFEQQAHDAFNPYATAGQTAFGQYQDALGMNGADGRTRAQTAFQAGPGYQWQVDQGTDAVARKNNALGITASGNTMDAITRVGSNLANQEYGSYLDRLNGVTQLGYNATGQQAGTYKDMAGLATGYGTNRANIYGQTAGQVGATYGQGAGYRQNAGNTNAQLITNTGQQLGEVGHKAMMSGQEAAATRLKLGMQVGGMALSALGGPVGMMGGSMLSGLAGGGAQ